MVQVTTVHDIELNQKVFKVRADEGYARTTKVFIEDADETETDNAYYTKYINVTVTRAIDSSYVAILDGDTTIDMVEWLSTDGTRKLAVDKLAYDINHEISVRYLGNSKCLKSHSNTITYNMENTEKHKTQIINTTESNYHVSHGGELKAELYDIEDENSPVAIEGEVIKIYADGIFIGSATTDSNGRISYNCASTPLSHGINDIEFIYSGKVTEDEAYNKSSTSFLYSVGLKINILSYPEVFVDGAENIVTAKVSNYWEEPLENIHAEFNTGSPHPSADSDENGILTFTVLTGQNAIQHRVVFTSGSFHSYSEYIMTYFATVTQISLTPSQSIVTPNTHADILIQVNGTAIRSGIAVKLSGGITGTYYTNDKGRVTVRYNGTGAGDTTISVAVGNTINTILIEDLLFYYGSNGQNYAPYKVFSGSVEPLTNGLRLNIPDYSHLALGIGNGVGTLEDYELQMTVVSDFESDGLEHNYGTFNSSTTGYTDPTELHSEYPSRQLYGSIFKIVREDGVVTFSEHDLADEPDYWWTPDVNWENSKNEYPVLIWRYIEGEQGRQRDYLIFNEIKLKRIVD